MRLVCHAHNAALEVALNNQLADLYVACCHRHEAGLVAAHRKLILGVALTTASAPDMVTAASGGR